MEIATSVMLRQGAGKGDLAARLLFTASMLRWLTGHCLYCDPCQCSRNAICQFRLLWRTIYVRSCCSLLQIRPEREHKALPHRTISKNYHKTFTFALTAFDTQLIQEKAYGLDRQRRYRATDCTRKNVPISGISREDYLFDNAIVE